MDNCGSCEAKLTPDIQWCPQCHAPVGPPRPGAPGAAIPRGPQAVFATSVAVPAGPGQPAPGSPTGLPPGEAPLPIWAQGSLRSQVSPGLPETAKYSRVKGGETSFGFVGRMVLSVGVVILGAIGYPAIMGNVGVPMTWTSFEIYLPGAILVAAIVMLRVWRPSRIDSRHR